MDVLKTAILEMCRQKKNEAFCPSEVLKLMFPEDWEQFIEEVNATAREMSREGLILITQNGNIITAIFSKSPSKYK